VFYQDARKVLELLHNLRRKRLERLNRRMGDLKYLSSMGLDAKDAKLEKEKEHIENNIAHWDIKLTTAKFLHDRVGNITHLCFFAVLHVMHYCKKLFLKTMKCRHTRNESSVHLTTAERCTPTN